jgi:heat shock protein HtpX
MYITEFFKKLFRKANIGIIIYLVLNILLYVALFGGFSGMWSMAVFGLFAYFLSMCVALSPIGEWILRKQTGCGEIRDKRLLERLMPLFERVYAQAQAKDPSIPDGIKLYMSNDAEPNAFATGRKTICITKGFLDYSDEHIMGTLAHEFAHLANKDTDLLLLITVGNMLMSALFLFYRIVINIFIFIFVNACKMGWLGSFLTSFLINIILTFLMWAWTKLGVMLVLHSGRQGEFAADRFAAELGYGDELCEVLDSFGTGEGRRGVWANLHSSHPESSERIAKIQEFMQNRGGEPAVSGGYTQPMIAPKDPEVSFAPNPVAGAAFAPKPQTKTNVCAGCSAELSDGTIFCNHCGAKVEEKPAVKFCNKCGNKMQADTRFCGGCGAAAN